MHIVTQLQNQALLFRQDTCSLALRCDQALSNTR